MVEPTPGLRSIAIRPSLDEDIQRRNGAHHDVGHVDRLADAKIDGDTAERLGLLGREAAPLQVFDHAEERIARRQREVFRFVATVPHADAGRGVKSAWCRHFRRGEVPIAQELDRTDTAPPRLPLVHAEFDMHDRAHLDRRTTNFAIPLSEMDITDGKERPLHPYGDEDARAGRQLLDVEITGILPRWNRAQSFGCDRLAGWNRPSGIRQ